MRNWEQAHQSSRHHAFYHSKRSSPLISSSTSREVPNSSTTRSSALLPPENVGPELLLTPVVEYLTNHRDDSPARPFARRRSNSTQSSGNNTPPPAPPVQYSIPLSDIMVVETYNARYSAPSNKLTVTTVSLGVFEFDCHTSNGHDILLAFLQASLAPERILDGSVMTCDGSLPCVEQSASSGSCLDVDGFTARHVRGRLESETWPEKISRRMGKVLNSMEEITGAFCDAATCCNQSQSRTSSARQQPEPRECPPSAADLRYHDLEFAEDDETSAARSPKRKEAVSLKNRKSEMLKLPSGLSLESEENPEMEAAR